MRFSTAIIALGFSSAAVAAMPLVLVGRGLCINTNTWNTMTRTGPATMEAIQAIRAYSKNNPRSRVSFGFYSPDDPSRTGSVKAVHEEALALVEAWIKQEFGSKHAKRFEFRDSHPYPFYPLKDPIQFYIEMDHLQKVYICAVSMVKKDGLILGIMQFHDLSGETDVYNRILEYYKLIEGEDAQIQLGEMKELRKMEQLESVPGEA
ncbi:hypothetical protein EV361DRAFT_933493 [Lentinula raphanica]|uniref:Uncharacterized protein n=1 Tax=Lentinula raphanica TaxID=153919 RepID=A0AA38U9N3_9AGAR|nr:hypothetical protein F5878DRAFT_727795 [Lentinula raphanica]KAJ3966827.1 hypothetical protein EV361DRAFT_933493 [Lentinula raphanica]